jgi:hypothetical protein
MASGLPSSESSAGFELQDHLYDCATSYMRTKVQQLARDYDQDLRINYLRQLRTLLSDVDGKRAQYDVRKRALMEEWRRNVTHLGVADGKLAAFMDELETTNPLLFSVIPEGSTVPGDPAEPWDESTNYTGGSLEEDRLLPGSHSADMTPMSLLSLTPNPQRQSPGTDDGRSQPLTTSENEQQHISTGPATQSNYVSGQKRPDADADNKANKRAKMNDAQVC